MKRTANPNCKICGGTGEVEMSPYQSGGEIVYDTTHCECTLEVIEDEYDNTSE